MLTIGNLQEGNKENISSLVEGLQRLEKKQEEQVAVDDGLRKILQDKQVFNLA